MDSPKVRYRKKKKKRKNLMKGLYSDLEPGPFWEIIWNRDLLDYCISQGSPEK